MERRSKFQLVVVHQILVDDDNELLFKSVIVLPARMANDDLLVRNTIQRLGVNASIEWTRQCIAFYRTQDAANSAASNHDIAQFVFEMYLLADFRILDPKPALPSSILTPHKLWLFKPMSVGSEGGGDGGVILQILELQDIGISSLKMLEACENVGVAGDQPGGFLVERTLPQGMITLDVTDGVRKLKAIVMEPISGIAMEMKLGAKIRVKDVEVRHGVLQLYRSNTTLLGGEVASMNQHPRRLVIMNQMKKRLGLPLDPMPTTSHNPSSASETRIVTRPTLNTSSNPSINNSVNISNNINSNTTANTSWKNPQSAVSAHDAIPSTTLLHNPQQGKNNPFLSSKESKIPQPTRAALRSMPDSSLSKLPLQVTPKIQSNPIQRQEELDPYLQMQRDQEPSWDLDQDLELEDLGGHADWEVSSQLFVDDSAKSKDKDSPPLIATRSPAKRGLLPRRATQNLRSPHSQHQKSQQQLRGGSWEELEINPFLDNHRISKENPSIESSTDAVQSRGGPGLDFFNLSQRSSPLSNSNSNSPKAGVKKRPLPHASPRAKVASKLEQEIKLEKITSRDDMCNSDIGFGFEPDDEYGPLLPPLSPVLDFESLQHGALHNDSAVAYNYDHDRDSSKKRRVSPERESADQDSYSDRRRSRSFSTSHWIEEDVKLKVKVETDNDKRKDANGPQFDVNSGVLVTSTTLSKHELDPLRDNSAVRSVSPEQSKAKVKIEVEKKPQDAKGAIYQTVIDLSSDDDNSEQDNSEHAMSRDRDVRGLDIQMRRIKAEPGDMSFSSRSKLSIASSSTSYSRRSLPPSNSPRDVGQATEPLVYVKKEETLLEFDFDDEDDFGGLAEESHSIPEVELDCVERLVYSGQEVKAKARAHKLGKFSLTNVAVSIPITLLAVPTKSGLDSSQEDESSHGDSATSVYKLETILDQGTVESMMGLSIADFRSLIVSNELEAKQAVAKLKTGLSMADTVQCHFGLKRTERKNDTLVIKDLKILSKRRK
ncbi:hypothetical protein BGX28_007511 [Mortierella sp. GBA30]|nr:hypothetical protein BGX28_007511 [Mortierella sp. GBA30]